MTVKLRLLWSSRYAETAPVSLLQTAVNCRSRTALLVPENKHRRKSLKWKFADLARSGSL